MAWWRALLQGGAKLVEPAASAHRPLLTDADRQKLEFLRLKTGAFLALTRDGARIGPRPGGMVEFHGHQNYVPGMDIRGLDWSVYARNRQWMVRQYAREAAAHIHLFVDGSGSMAFGLDSLDGHTPRRTTKFRTAARLAAMIACIALSNQDRVSLYVARANGDAPELLSLRGLTGMSQLPAVLRFLEGIEPAGQIRDRDMIRSILSTQPERGMFVWLTDGLNEGLLETEAPVGTAAAVGADGQKGANVGATAGAGAAGARTAEATPAITAAPTLTQLERCLGWASQAIGRVWLVQVQAEADWWVGDGRLELVDSETGAVHGVNVSSQAKEPFRQAALEHARQIGQAVSAYGGSFLTIRDHEDPFARLYACLQG